jgi:hypothetical protein
VRHDPEIRVRTSGRLRGRAIGGFSDGMRRRAKRWNDPCDDRLQPIERALGWSIAAGREHQSLRPTELPVEIIKAVALLAIMRIVGYLMAFKLYPPSAKDQGDTAGYDLRVRREWRRQAIAEAVGLLGRRWPGNPSRPANGQAATGLRAGVEP